MLLRSFYDQIILKYSKTVLLLILLGVAFLGYEARKLEIDASSETLLLEDDKDLEYTRLINQRYYTPDFLVVSYTPSGISCRTVFWKRSVISARTWNNWRGSNP